MSCGLSFGTHPNNGWHMWFNSEAPGGVTHNDVGGYPRFTADTTMKPWEFHVASELKPSPIFRQTRCKCLLKTSVVGLHQSMWKKSTRASHQAIISHSWYQTGDSHDLNRRYIWMECTGRPTAGWKIGKKKLWTSLWILRIPKFWRQISLSTSHSCHSWAETKEQ